MKLDLDKITKNFILTEGTGPTVVSWVQALSENIHSLKPRTVSENRRIEIMKHQIKEIKRSSRKMQEKISLLEEQVTTLKEEKNNE